MAAVLDWRLPEPAHTRVHPPLPWLPGLPQAISNHPEWGDYLTQRSQLIAKLAHDVRHHALRVTTQPAWAPQDRELSATLIGEIAVWRAANAIDPNDQRPTGPAQLQTASIEWRQRLDQSIARASADPAGLDAPRRQAAARTLQSRRHDNQDPRPDRSEIHRGSLPPSPGR
jgi:hypothetical protein